MYRRIAVAIFTLSISVHCYAQRDPERRWTDKNNAEQYAAYMIQIAYYERGYMGARVQVRDDGATKVFEVEPGRIDHIKAMQILGRNDLPAEAMSTDFFAVKIAICIIRWLASMMLHRSMT